MFGKPTGVVLLALFLIVGFSGDLYYGGSMLYGAIPIPTAYTAIGVFYAILLLIGAVFSLFLLYGIWNLKNWARLIVLIGFPAQVFFNIIIDPMNYDNFFLLAVSLIITVYTLMPSTREHFS